ncbi:MAG: ABC transporter ATP-binding protein, partial [Anaerolineales bacterium]
MTKGKRKEKIALKDYSRILKVYLSPQKKRVVVLAGFIFINLGLQLLIPQIMGAFIDGVTQAAGTANLIRLGAAFLTVALLQQVFSVIATYFTQNVAWQATNTLREDLTRYALNLDMGFHKAHPPGEMISRIDSDINTLNDFFSQFLLMLVGNLLLVVAILALLYIEDWRIGLVMTAFSLIALLILSRFRNIAVPHWEAERQAEADFYSFLEERLGGTADIRANGGRVYTLRGFFARIQTMYQRSIKAGLMVNIMLNSMLLVFVLGNAVSLGLGGTLYLNGAITIGTVYIIFQYSRMLERPLEDISRQLSNVQKAFASLKRVLELLGISSKITSPAHDISTLNSRNKALALQFEHVSFHYEDQANGKLTTSEDDDQFDNVLEDISFQLATGEVLGLLGRTGSGKTTLTRLLFRLYDPQNGRILLAHNDHQVDLFDIRRMPILALRQQIGMVTQNIELFHATVRDNLTFFEETIPDEQIISVIRQLGLSRWYAGLQYGLDTILEASATSLSAGEAQLLAFSRIFLH